jgi:hypothetical protein
MSDAPNADRVQRILSILRTDLPTPSEADITDVLSTVILAVAHQTDVFDSRAGCSD